MKPISSAGPILLAVVLAFPAPARAQEGRDLDALIEKLNRQVDELQKEVNRLQAQIEDLTRGLAEKTRKLRPDRLLDRFKDLLPPRHEFEDFDFQMPDLDELLERFGGGIEPDKLFEEFEDRFGGGMDLPELMERFREQFGDEFDLDGILERFRDQFDGMDLQRMMEEFRRMMEPPFEDPDDEVI